jgi:hypothetical protein
VLWARFARFVRFVRYEMECLLVLAWTRIGLEIQGFGTGSMHKTSAYDIYDYYSALEMGLKLLSWGMLRGRALVGGGSMWWGFYPYWSRGAVR